jgi:hypothetical protein
MTRRNRIITALTPWFAGFRHPIMDDMLFVVIMLVSATCGAVLAAVFG